MRVDMRQLDSFRPAPVLAINLAALGIDDCVGSQVDEVDAVTAGAGDRVQIVSQRLGRPIGKQSLDAITGGWTREDNGAPSPSVCHLHNPDEITSSGGTRRAALTHVKIPGRRSRRRRQPRTGGGDGAGQGLTWPAGLAKAALPATLSGRRPRQRSRSLRSRRAGSAT